MLPSFLYQQDSYVPPKDGGTFIKKTILSIGKAMSRLKMQKGHEKKHALPALAKFLLLIALILLCSITQNRLVLLAILAVLQAYLCLWPAQDIPSIIKPSLFASFLALILFLPAICIHPEGAANNLIVIAKVFASVEMVSIFNHTTQWNHITVALKKLHIPGVFIFTLDITIKYIVLLGTLINDILTSLALRSIGRNNKKYQSIGGVMGVTFLRSTEMSQQMYEAMVCRGFTDDYKGL